MATADGTSAASWSSPELHEPRAVGELVGDGVCCGEGEAGLAGPSWAGDGHQPVRADHVDQSAQLVLAADQRGGRVRQVAGAFAAGTQRAA